MAKSSLAALAILKVNWETQGTDYLDNFMPMVVSCLAQTPDDVVSLPDLQVHFAERFGIEIPLNPLKSILGRAVRAGYLRRDHGVLYKEKKINESRFDDDEVQLNEMLDEVVLAIQVHARQRFDRDLTSGDAEDALLSFLSAQDATLLFASFEGTPLRRLPEDLSLTYIVASFVYDAWEEGSDAFSRIETLAKGSILATALFLPDPGQVSRRFRETKIFFDTSFLMFAAGYAGEHRESARVELLQLLQDTGAELYVFSETLDEMRGILDACAAVMRRRQFRTAYGPSIEYFIRHGMSSSDIDLLAARIPERLRFLGVEVEDRPPFDEHAHIIDEIAFAKHLETEISYRNPDARRHDVDCIAAIARLRRGRNVFSVEQCRALFVTTNVALVRTTRAFFHDSATPGSVPLALTGYALGTLLWLKNPAKARELPKRMLIAHAHATLQPSDELWKRYLTEIARLEENEEISQEDCYLLRFTVGAKRAFMDITKGVGETFVEGTIKEVLQIAIENTRADVTDKLKEEAVRREEVEQRLGQTAAALVKSRSTLEKRAERRSERRKEVARKVAKAVTLIPRLTFYGLMFLAVIYAFPWELPSPGSAWFRYLLTAALVLLLVLEISGVGWGHTLKTLMDRLDRAVASWIDKKLLWLQGDDDMDRDGA